MATKHHSEFMYNQILNTIESVMGDKITTNHQLDAYMKQFPHIPYFGSFPMTIGLRKIPYLKDNESLILNTTDHGEHWTVVHHTGGKYYFYDSFGRKFKDLFDSKLPLIDTDLSDREQQTKFYEDDTEEENCGQRCLAWILLVHLYGIEAGIHI